MSNCPDAPHIHLPDGRIALVPLELAVANKNTFLYGRRVGFTLGFLTGVLIASIVMLIGLILGG